MSRPVSHSSCLSALLFFTVVSWSNLGRKNAFQATVSRAGNILLFTVKIHFSSCNLLAGLRFTTPKFRISVHRISVALWLLLGKDILSDKQVCQGLVFYSISHATQCWKIILIVLPKISLFQQENQLNPACLF